MWRSFRRALIFAFLISGFYFMIKSLGTPTITGAYLGVGSLNPAILLGVVFFLVALGLAHYEDKKI